MLQSNLTYRAGPAAAILLPLLLFFTMRSRDSWNPIWNYPADHFYIVSIVSILAVMISIAIGISAGRLRNIKLSFLALTFLSLGGIFSVHGLSTPGFIVQSSPLPGVSAQGSVLVASFWLWLSSLPSDNRLLRRISAWHKVLLPGWFLFLVTAGIAIISLPHLAHNIPINQDPLKWPTTGVIALLCGTVIYRYLRSFLYARLPLQLSIVYSACLLIDAQIIMAAGTPWTASWWIYHYLLLAVVILMIVSFIRHTAAGLPLSHMFKALFSTNPKDRIEACISPSVKALVSATESRDLYTAGHNFRVAMYALRLGEEMGLSPEQLRALAQGTVVHDVGKIQIPDSILNKPGRLTAEERTVIETHPVIGYEMCKRVGFMKDELDVIRSHHERWDGKGYPDQLKETSIPLLARITAVADVYDALTSTRSYRVAWTHEAAMEHLRAGIGTQFDPDCVKAWIALCDREPAAYQEPHSMQTCSTLTPLSSVG